MSHYNEPENVNLLPSTNQDVENQNNPKRDWKFYLVWCWRFLIFAITGSSSVHVTRFLLNAINCTNEKWYYYIAFFIAELFVYTAMIVAIGSVLGQWRFFSLVAFKMWSWLLPMKTKMDLHKRLYGDKTII